MTPAQVFFTDRDLGKKFPAILREGGLTVERHADHFPADCPDEDWLREVGHKGWIAVTHDQRIRYKPNELAAVIDNRVALLVVIGQVPYPELARHSLPPIRVSRPSSKAIMRRTSPRFIGRYLPVRIGIQDHLAA
jgi:hypothetical protein